MLAVKKLLGLKYFLFWVKIYINKAACPSVHVRVCMCERRKIFSQKESPREFLGLDIETKETTVSVLKIQTWSRYSMSLSQIIDFRQLP